MTAQTKVIIGIAVVVGLVIVLVVRFWLQTGSAADVIAEKKKAVAEARGRASPATAKVLESEPLPHEIRDQHGFGAYREVKITLQMNGGERSVELSWDVKVTSMPKIAPGETVSVLVDPQQGGVYPAEDWARTTIYP